MTTPDTAALCSCGRPIRYPRRGLCHPCYERGRRRPHQRGELSSEQRFFAKVRPADDPLACWTWSGNVGSRGYGKFIATKGHRVLAHRWSYELLVSEIPAGLVIDHLCRNTLCVNPWHMEPVTIAVNSLRGQSPSVVTWRRGICKRGHSVDGRGACRQCIRERSAIRAADPEFRARRAAHERERKARKAAAA